MKKALNRRGFVRNLGIAGAALVGTGLLTACGDSPISAHASTLDNTSGDSAQQIFTAALIAEDLATTFYFNGLSAGAITAGLQADDIGYLKAALNEEIDHATLLRAQLSITDTTKDPVQMFLFPAGSFSSQATFLSVLDALENAFIGAYLAAVKEFAQMAADTKSGDKTQMSAAGMVYTSVQLEYFAEVSASILGVECEHRALGRSIAGMIPADNECFQMQDSITTVFNGSTSAAAALGPFITNGDISAADGLERCDCAHRIRNLHRDRTRQLTVEASSLGVILRKRSPSLREGLPTKDLCIAGRQHRPTPRQAQ